MEKVKIKIYDNAFAHAKSSSGDNESKYIDWYRGDDYHELAFFTDQNLFNFYQYKSKIKIAWLIEPVSIRPNSYDFVKYHYQRDDFFDYILTFDKELCKLSDKFIYYPFGGSWIPEEDFKIYDKSKMVSIISSAKCQSSGQRKRHAVIEYHKDKMDVMGHGYKSIESKKEGLCDYRYSIIIENIKQNDYFTEKLIDCLSTGTVPIYWGTENIGNYFDARGIIQFDTVSDVGHVLENVISEKDYLSRIEHIKYNLEECKKYRVAEDYIYEQFLVKKGLI